MFSHFLESDEIYKPEQIHDVLKMVRPNFRFTKTGYDTRLKCKIKYFNIPCAFDIETSSFFRSTGNGAEKCACMYEWTFGIYGAVIVGRTWDEFKTMMIELYDELKLSEEKRLLIFVHNLSYEFQFIRKHFEWLNVFSLEIRKPVYAISSLGFEFRCSYLLSGYSLDRLGKQLQKYHVEKLTGALDYSKIRHCKTPMSDKEIAYCVNDVRVVMAYIAERIEQDGDLSKIPLTKTGYVRQFCRESCFVNSDTPKDRYKKLRYLEIMKGLTLEPDEYRQLKRAFQGGFTHANPFYSGKVVKYITSFDFTSSYPCVMIAEQFPMSKGELIEITSRDEFYKNLKLYCCLFDVEFVGLESKVFYDSYISESRCWQQDRVLAQNGRVVSAGRICITITEQDFMIIRKFYKWDHMRIGNFRRYRRGYLPTDFVRAILKLYGDKTTLKGVDGREVDYLKSKEMLNSCYGMSVTDIVRDEVIYTEDWQELRTPDIEETIKRYNESKTRFLFYAWGVWVTAYARRNLFSGICEFGGDYLYSDTDSIKVRNAEKHMDYINKYNELIREQLCRAMDYHKIDHAAIEPETIQGVKKCLGVWDFDGHYEMFKTLGAKRYLVRYSDDERNGKNKGKFSLTVSGLNKSVCVPYMLNRYGESGIMENFTDDLYIPANYTGKNTHTYIDERRKGTVIDYLGNPGNYDELSSVHLEAADYSLSIPREYRDYIIGLETKEL